MSTFIWNKLGLLKQDGCNTWIIEWYDTTNYIYSDFTNKIDEIDDWIEGDMIHSDVKVQIINGEKIYERDNEQEQKGITSLGTRAVFWFKDVEDSMAFKLKYEE